MSIMDKIRKKTEESPSEVQIKQAGNGYIVERIEKLSKPKRVSSLFGPQEVESERCEYVFSSLSEVAAFLSDHFQDPLVKI